MKKLIVLFGCIFAINAWADDVSTVNVSQRLTCVDIQNKITELVQIVDPDDEIIAELTKLKADYRRKCAKVAASRRSSATSMVVIETEEKAQEVEENPENSTTEEEDKAEEEVKTEEVASSAEEVAPEDTMTEEEKIAAENAKILAEVEKELANLDAGLCVDGSKPNKFGCCGDEIFRDLGNAVFACCPKDGGNECFPPFKQQ